MTPICFISLRFLMYTEIKKKKKKKIIIRYKCFKKKNFFFFNKTIIKLYIPPIII